MKVNIHSNKTAQIINGENITINNSSIALNNESLNDSSNEKQLVDSIKELVSKNEIEKVLNLILKHCQSTNSDKTNDFILLKQKYILTTEGNLRGIISRHEYGVEITNIANAILMFSDKMKIQ